jgi:hypothetical protein
MRPPVWLELWLWRREIAKIRKDMSRIEAEIERLSHLDPSPEVQEMAAKHRADLSVTEHRLVRLEEKIDHIAEVTRQQNMVEILTWLSITLGILLLALLGIAYGILPPLFQ